jgi:hypothetical protein
MSGGLVCVRVVDEHIDILPFLGQVGYKFPHSSWVTDIQLDWEDLDAIADLSLDVLGDLLELVDAAGREDQAEVIGAGASKVQGGRAANARRRTGDEDGLAGKALGSSGRHGKTGDIGRCGRVKASDLRELGPRYSKVGEVCARGRMRRQLPSVDQVK